ncbi:MAG: L,D-transpeptidase [Syntrophobacteraceae bacterium]
MQQADVLPYWEDLPEVRPVVRPPISPKLSASPPKTRKELGLVHRVVTEKELKAYEHRDPDLHFNRCIEILCRLNGKDKEYIRDDIKRKRALTIPRNFAAYKDWSPLPATITGTEKIPKFVLIVKDICFLGWYEKGRLVGDTYVCIGKMNTWTKRGMYRVKEKDPDHMSHYPNAYGEPARMPFAMRVYDRVWIHAGDVVGRNCSRGCINVPLFTSNKLYTWTQIGTPVLITESLKDLGRDVKSGLSAGPASDTRTKTDQRTGTPPKPSPEKPAKSEPRSNSIKDIL